MLEAINLSKVYKDKTALLNLNLSIGKGEIFCLLGQNGAGKTTTINLFLGFVDATGGNVKINGIDVLPGSSFSLRQEARKHLAYIPENVMLYPHLSGIENLDYFSAMAGFRYRADELAGLLSRSGLPADAQQRRVGGYSKGMRQKVGIAIALAKKAEALLLDEPTSGLDPKATNEFSLLLEDLASQGAAILMATHDIFRAKQVGTRVGIMKEGALVKTLRTDDIEHTALENLYLEFMND
jgi:ABC-2 type transport system ATP-binding protein